MAADLTDQLAEALRDVLAAVRGSNRLPETTMQAERALDAIRAARKKAEAALSAYAAARGVLGTLNEQENDHGG
jgi:2-keto-3-deoxy-6-phosphogluconate aldolase